MEFSSSSGKARAFSYLFAWLLLSSVQYSDLFFSFPLSFPLFVLLFFRGKKKAFLLFSFFCQFHLWSFPSTHNPGFPQCSFLRFSTPPLRPPANTAAFGPRLPRPFFVAVAIEFSASSQVQSVERCCFSGLQSVDWAVLPLGREVSPGRHFLSPTLSSNFPFE